MYVRDAKRTGLGKWKEDLGGSRCFFLEREHCGTIRMDGVF